jgi:hypothetical protein
VGNKRLRTTVQQSPAWAASHELLAYPRRNAVPFPPPAAASELLVSQSRRGARLPAKPPVHAGARASQSCLQKTDQSEGFHAACVLTTVVLTYARRSLISVFVTCHATQVESSRGMPPAFLGVHSIAGATQRRNNLLNLCNQGSARPYALLL